MMEEMIVGPASSIASHCASKLGGLTSPASAGTAGPHLPRKRRTASSEAEFAFGRWIGHPEIELKAAVSSRTHV